MTIEVGKQYKTLSGSNVRIYAVDGGVNYCVHGAYEVEGSGWLARCWTAEGLARVGEIHELDLIAVEPRIKRTYWVNLYQNMEEGFWSNEQNAKNAAKSDIIARVKIEIDVEEGHGL